MSLAIFLALLSALFYHELSDIAHVLLRPHSAVAQHVLPAAC